METLEVAQIDQQVVIYRNKIQFVKSRESNLHMARSEQHICSGQSQQEASLKEWGVTHLEPTVQSMHQHELNVWKGQPTMHYTIQCIAC